MSTEKKPKRKYVTLSDDDWATIRAEWEGGDVTLADLSDRFGVSIRSIQNFFERHGIAKGSARRAETMAAIRLAVPEPSPANASDPDAIKSLALQRILAIEDAISDQINIMRTDPTQAYRCGSTVKSLQSAVDALSKAYQMKREVLGLDRQDAQEKTVLVVRELFSEDIARLCDDEENEDDDPQPIEREDDDIVLES